MCIGNVEAPVALIGVKAIGGIEKAEESAACGAYGAAACGRKKRKSSAVSGEKNLMKRKWRKS